MAWALTLSIIALAIALGGVVVNLWLYHRSGYVLKVRISLDRPTREPMDDAVIVEYWNAGRLPVDVRRVGVREVQGTNSLTGLDLQASDAVEKLHPNSPPLQKRFPMQDIIDRWDPGRRIILRAWVLGPLRRKYSPGFFWQLTVRTPQRPGRPTPGLRILRAPYGADGQTVDIARRLQERVVNCTLDVGVTNELAGEDPLEGTPKFVDVEYVFDGARRETRVPEGGTLTLP